MSTKIFVSSVSSGLEEIRERVNREIEELGHKPIFFESNDFAKSSQTSMVKTCLKEIENSDMYILIIGEEVGFKLVELEKSVTHLELRKAISTNKKMLVFVQDYIKTAYFREFSRISKDLKKQKKKEPTFDEIIKKLSNHSIKKEVFNIVHDAYQNVPWLFTFKTAEDIKSVLKSELSSLLKSYIVLQNNKQIDSIDDIILASERLEQYDSFLEDITPSIARIAINDINHTLQTVQSNLKGGTVFFDEGAEILTEMVKIGNCEGASLYKFNESEKKLTNVAHSGLPIGEQEYDLNDKESFVSIAYNEYLEYNSQEDLDENTIVPKIFVEGKLLYICNTMESYVFVIRFPIEGIFVDNTILENQVNELYLGIMELKANNDVIRFLSFLLTNF
jgi:hypothetical protein